MPAITKEQTLAILRGNRLFNSVASPHNINVVFSKWSGVTAKDLFNPSGIDLGAPAALIYPYIPGISNPPSQIFTFPANGQALIQDSITLENVLLINNGGSLDNNSTLSRTERDYHLTGAKLRSKLK